MVISAGEGKMTPHGDSAAPIRVLVVNESGIIREGLCRLLERIADIEVVAGIGHPQSLETMARQRHIDVVLIDANLPGDACFDVPRRLREREMTTAVVILSVSNGIGDVRRALNSGASGFLLQDAGVAELDMALHAAAAGKTFLCPTIVRQLAKGSPLENGSNQGVPVDGLVEEALRLGILKQEG